MNRLLYLSLAAIIMSFTVNAQSVEKTFESESLRVVYHQSNGMFDGLYSSYYANGSKKAEGSFANNQRIGKWLVWDEGGKALVQREYKTSLDFIQTNPVNKKIIPYTLQRNYNGVIENVSIEEENVGWIQRVWRAIPEENNGSLFDDNILFQIIHENILTGKVMPYSTKTDDMGDELDPWGIDFSSRKVLYYKVKEESFFDTKRMVLETRIIGICPVILDKKTNNPKDLVWVYFPELRTFLAKHPVRKNQTPNYIKNLDDIFYYRYFSSQITKVSNVNDRAIEDYKEDAEIEEEATKFEMLSIEREHNSWVK